MGRRPGPGQRHHPGPRPPAVSIIIGQRKIARAWIRPSGGIAVPHTPAVVTAYQRPGPAIRRPGPARAVTGHGTVAGGIASRIVTPLGSPQYSLPVVPGRRPPPLTRAVFGGRIGLATVYAFPPPVTWQVAPVLPLTVTITPAAPMTITAAPAAPMAVTAAEPGLSGSTTLQPPAAVTITPPPVVQAGPAHGPIKE